MYLRTPATPEAAFELLHRGDVVGTSYEASTLYYHSQLNVRSAAIGRRLAGLLAIEGGPERPTELLGGDFLSLQRTDMSLAVEDIKTALDLSAAAAEVLSPRDGSNHQGGVGNGVLADVESVARRRPRLCPPFQVWLTTIQMDPAYTLLRQWRNTLVHRDYCYWGAVQLDPGEGREVPGMIEAPTPPQCAPWGPSDMGC